VRIVRSFEDELLLVAIDEAYEWYQEEPTDTQAGYLSGLRAAAIILGTVKPTYRQERALRRKGPRDRTGDDTDRGADADDGDDRAAHDAPAEG
jgi:hypothetical protein